MLTVVVPFVGADVHPETRGAVEAYINGSLTHSAVAIRGARLAYVSLNEDPVLGYGKLVKELWVRGEDWMMVEQDIEVGPTTVYDMRACSYLYCANPYAWTTDVGCAMGSTRFRAEFMAKYPDAVDEALAITGNFRQFDVVLQRRILASKYGEHPHVHAPVVHWNIEKALRPGANPEPLARMPIDIGNIA